MRQLKFPTYEYIKSLPTASKADKGYYYEYDWKLFATPTGDKGVISYNLDEEGWIYFDVFEDGYSEVNHLGLALKLNKANCAKLCKHAQKVYEEFYRALDEDYSQYWEKYGEKQQ